MIILTSNGRHRLFLQDDERFLEEDLDNELIGTQNSLSTSKSIPLLINPRKDTDSGSGESGNDDDSETETGDTGALDTGDEGSDGRGLVWGPYTKVTSSSELDGVEVIDIPAGHIGQNLQCIRYKHDVHGKQYALCAFEDRDPCINPGPYQTHPEAENHLKSDCKYRSVWFPEVFGEYAKQDDDPGYRWQGAINGKDGNIQIYTEGPEPDIALINCARFWGGCAAVHNWHRAW